MARIYLVTEDAKNASEEKQELRFYFDENNRLVIQSGEVRKVILSDKDTSDLKEFINEKHNV